MPSEIALRGISKSYPGVVAVDQVDLEINQGEIHAIVGENGAGKTTLMSILFGLVPPDQGRIEIRGQPIQLYSALDAITAGMGMVHQSFKLFPSLTVVENVVFRAEPQRRGRIDRKVAVEQVLGLAAEYGLEVDPTAVVESLPVGVLQRVEILKALYRDAQILILDEPTAVLTPQERKTLFTVIRRLAQSGRTILFITHKLEEVMELSERVTVLRQGKKVITLNTADTDPAEITLAMTGRNIAAATSPVSAMPTGEPVLVIDSLTVSGEHDTTSVDNVSLEVRAGEVVGIAGVAGNGQSELIEALVGLRDTDSGRIILGGRDITKAEVAERRSHGLSYIPEDRYREGTSGLATISENLIMGHHRFSLLQRGGWFLRSAIREMSQRLVGSFGIRNVRPGSPAATLSGGNLQKVVIAREMDHQSPLLVAEQPTRGVDVGAIEFIHGQLLAARDEETAILLVSAELTEIMALSTRILVMFEGRIVAELNPPVDEVEIGSYMTGVGEPVLLTNVAYN